MFDFLSLFGGFDEDFVSSKLEEYYKLLYASKQINTQVFNYIFALVGIDELPTIEEPDEELTPEVMKLQEIPTVSKIPNVSDLLGTLSKIQKLEQEANKTSVKYLLSQITRNDEDSAEEN